MAGAVLLAALAAPSVATGQALWQTYMRSGREALAAGDAGRAAELFRSALAEARAFPAGDPRLGETYQELGRAHWLAGELPSAESRMLQSLKVFEQALGPTDPQLAVLHFDLGRIDRRRGLTEPAETHLKLAIGGWDASATPPPELATALAELAALYLDQGRLPQAEALQQRALDLRSARDGSESPAAAEALVGLAEIRRAQKRDADAQQLLERALAATAAAKGAEHEDLAPLLEALARTCHARGDRDGAERHLRRAIEIRQPAPAPRRAGLGAALHELAELYREQRRFADAEPLYERALVAYTEALGAGAAPLAPVLEDYAALLWSTGRKVQAAQLQVRAKWVRSRS